MSGLTRAVERLPKKHFQIICSRYSSTEASDENVTFKPLNIRGTKGQQVRREPLKKAPVPPPRTNEMKVDQDWGNVWPGPRSFHPATVPLPVRQGFMKNAEAAPGKFGNAELMKIPNFLHLTPPVIKRQCEALKQFCTPWPKALTTEDKCEKHFPLTITSSTYCHSSPSIRDPLSRIITIKIKLANLQLDKHSKDKLRRLVGDRYNEKTDILSIVTDRCPTRKQNYDYAMYLLTALYHEAWTVEPWEKLKTEADMEHYEWDLNESKKSIQKMFGKECSAIPNSVEYRTKVEELMNEGESEYTMTNYGNAVRKLLSLPEKLQQ